ncbi:nucleotide exchange factor GrpE [Candidatus Vidania fulgoroideorum]
MISKKKYIEKVKENILLKIGILEKIEKKNLEIERNKYMILKNNDDEKFKIFKSIIPVLDSLEISILKCNDKSLKEGLQITLNILIGILRKNNIVNINTVKNSLYNPHYHEAIVRVKSYGKKNTIYNILQKGYIYLNKVLRPTIVCITF